MLYAGSVQQSASRIARTSAAARPRGTTGRVESVRGQLLLAHPGLIDPNFRRTVVLMIEHAEEGAMGLVLNRPSMVAVAKASSELEPLVEPEDLVYVGGPVAPEGVMVLAEFDDPDEAATIVAGDLGLVRADADFATAAAATRRARVFAGHAGWAPEQLEAELEGEGWIVEEHPPVEELLTDEPETLWSRVLERKGGQYALLARMPVDPSVN
jgi:putative transcriptional regulator